MPPSRGLRLDVRLVSLCHVCFPPSLKDRLQRRYTYGTASHLTLYCTTWGTFSYDQKAPAHWGEGGAVALRIREYLSLFLCRLVVRTHFDDPIEQMGPAECL